MADAVRDVLIQVRLKTVDTEVTPPDTEAATGAFNQIRATVSETTGEVERLNAAIANLEQGGATTATLPAPSEGAPDQTGGPNVEQAEDDFARVSEAAKESAEQVRMTFTASTEATSEAFEEASDNTDDSLQTIRESVDQLSKDVRESNEQVSAFGQDVDTSKLEKDLEGLGEEFEELEDEMEAAQEKAEEMQTAVTDNSLAAAEGLKTAGDGAITMARGLALVGVSAEDDLAQVVEQIAHIQGMFDIFKGGIDVVKGTVEGFRALKAAATASTAAEAALAAAHGAEATAATASTTANTGLAASQTAVGTTATAAAGGVAALTAALLANPVTAILVGIATAVGVVAAAWAFFSDDAPEEVEEASSAVDDLKTKTDEFNEALQDLKVRRGFTDELVDLNDRLDSLGGGGGTPVEDKLEFRQQQLEKNTAALRKSTEDLQSLTNIDLGDDVLGIGNLERIADIDLSVVNPSEAEALKGVVDATLANQEMQKESLSAQADLLADQEDQLRQNLQLENERLDAASEQVKTAREALEVAKEEAATKEASFEQQIGQLSDAEFAQVQRIGQKVAGGEELSEREAQILRDTGVSEEFARRQEERRGEERGATDLAEQLGVDLGQEGVSAAERQLEEATRERKELENRLLPKIQGLRSQIVQNEQQQAEVVTEIREIVVQMTDTNSLAERLRDDLNDALQQKQANEV